MESRDSWVQLCSFGPTGFVRYGRLFHPLDPDQVETNPDDLASLEGDLRDDAFESLVEVLVRHTSTPDDCFFGLWDGFGDIHGGPSAGLLTTGSGKRRQERAHRIPPAFPPEVIDGPKVEIPARSYFLFRGPLEEGGHWGQYPSGQRVVRALGVG